MNLFAKCFRTLCFNKNEAGGAVVEVALLSLLMVPISIYAIFFYDFAYMNLKVSEASRYLAWEMTNMQISDYKNYTHHSNPTGFLNDRISNLKQEVRERWGDDMNSATIPSDSSLSGSTNGTLFSMKQSGLSVAAFDKDNGDEGSGSSENYLTINLSDRSVYEGVNDSISEPDDMPDDATANDNQMGIFGTLYRQLSGYVNRGANYMYKYFHFNRQGFVKSEIKLKMKFSHTAPIYRGSGMLEDAIPFLSSSEMLIVDAWDLKNGNDADYGQYGQGPDDGGAGQEYKNQVEKMTLFGVPNWFSEQLGGFGNFIETVINRMGLRSPTAAVVRSFALKNANLTDKKSGESVLRYGNKRVDTLDSNAPESFHTNVFKDTWNKNNSFYYKVYKAQSPDTSGSSGYYMGCKNPCARSLNECWEGTAGSCE